ncbi:zinc transporter ZIP1-like [Mytilus californianus]|uniref:zinc transporter ZIP1-like n=1 Tax=Mytilus californianus TaxID=6549 RepID=UPI002245C625|nr:zinc transporter ZIP1-like [Mytilus californianus]
MEVKIVKVLILFGLLLISFVLGFIPIKWIWHFKEKTKEKSKTFHLVISILSCFAAGVFLATCLLHLLVETRLILEDQLKDVEIFSEYPVSEFIMVIGLLCMLATEQLVMTYQEYIENTEETEDSHLTLINESSFEMTERNENDANRLSSSEEQRTRMNMSESSIEGLKQYNTTMRRPSAVQNKISPAEMHASQTDNSVFRSILLILALSLHSVFEGLAVGLQTETSSILKIFTGLVIHKGVISFSLGLALSQSSLSYCASLRSLLIFSAASPIGVAIGLIVDGLGVGSSPSLAIGILEGLACGTFLYVTFFEILQHEFSN